MQSSSRDAVLLLDSKLPPKHARALEVELIIAAHVCFVSCCDLQRINLVLNCVKSRVKDYASNGEYMFLVKLLVGLKCYDQLTEIFHLLIQYYSCDIY
jgi:hypothetical protein